MIFESKYNDGVNIWTLLKVPLREEEEEKEESSFRLLLLKSGSFGENSFEYDQSWGVVTGESGINCSVNNSEKRCKAGRIQNLNSLLAGNFDDDDELLLLLLGCLISKISELYIYTYTADKKKDKPYENKIIYEWWWWRWWWW